MESERVKIDRTAGYLLTWVFILTAFLLCSCPSEADGQETTESDAEILADQRLIESFSITLSQEGVSRFLQALRPNEESNRLATDLIQKLSDMSFSVREAATLSLQAMPNAPVELLLSATKSDDPETASRASAILKSDAVQKQVAQLKRRPEVIVAVSRLIARRSFVGLTDELLQAALFVTDPDSILALGDALAASARAEDIELIRETGAIENVYQRAVAVRGRAAILGTKIQTELIELSRSQSDLLALAAAQSLAEQQDRHALPSLVALLRSPHLEIRIRSKQILMAATGEKFELNAYADPMSQPASYESLNDWLRDSGDSVKIIYPIVLKALPEDISEGLLLHYAFDDDELNTILDSSGHDQRGKSANDYRYRPGVLGQAIEFVGEGHMGESGGHALLPSIDFSKLDAFTIALWANQKGMTHPEGEAYIVFGMDRGVGVDGAIGISQYNNELFFRVGEGNVKVTFDRADLDHWVHYAMVFADGRLTAYKNGIAIGSKDARVSETSGNAALGRHWWQDGAGTSTRYIGAFDEVRFYGRALTSEQIRMLATQKPFISLSPSFHACE
jgi:Concanavalin A-like lectin/glucanases superfamily